MGSFLSFLQLETDPLPKSGNNVQMDQEADVQNILPSISYIFFVAHNTTWNGQDKTILSPIYEVNVDELVLEWDELVFNFHQQLEHNYPGLLFKIDINYVERYYASHQLALTARQEAIESFDREVDVLFFN